MMAETELKADVKNTKLCPLTRNMCSERCAWFDRVERKCAVLVIAVMMSGQIRLMERERL
jgi:hypothetical protein